MGAGCESSGVKRCDKKRENSVKTGARRVNLGAKGCENSEKGCGKWRIG